MFCIKPLVRAEKMGIKYQNPLIFKSVSFFLDQTLFICLDMVINIDMSAKNEEK